MNTGLVLLTASGGSKGMPRKNLLNMQGKSLIVAKKQSTIFPVMMMKF